MRTLVILGSTGSVGTQALDVVRRNPDRFKVVGLSAGTNQELLIGQIREFLPPFVAIADEDAARDLKERLSGIRGVEMLVGPEAAETLARDAEADMVLNALVGSAGLAPTLGALQAGKTLALANKESLVIGGELVLDLIKGEPERLIPVDSEHAALAQCLRGERREDVKRVILTGSGGPFRGWTHAELAKASVKEALAHPVWQMGPKITIDSATLMNKGLEVIEAHYLFGIDYGQIHVVIHPEGIVHALAEFRDGSMTAQLAMPDMKLPIQLALGWPERLPTGVEPVPLTDRRLTFEPVDREAFPAIDLAYRVGELGLTFPAVMSAANEVAVMAFLEGKIPLTRIVEVVTAVVDEHEVPSSVVSVVNLERADAWARHRAAELIEAR
ncbi:MAG: 1-deoxy-D-xylulose-5-phosphate reductoisomerase [Actinobacteria bacterium RBG_19FT_COMBO_70_19]|jgi:1-deoxy-D-xylulose-5-phosphate reductoisomerase|nr:MAG: 1-deoxy-D-xylulose-5-phosphate reductoisomerase [Actinobacteria bacterium RBG_19FT_COMBO_70_19]